MSVWLTVSKPFQSEVYSLFWVKYCSWAIVPACSTVEQVVPKLPQAGEERILVGCGGLCERPFRQILFRMILKLG